jgi:tetratricopeptide (TPR) repeat protein
MHPAPSTQHPAPQRASRWIVLLLLAATAAACSRKTVVTVPTVTTPKFPDFVRPSVPPSFANTAAAVGEERGWAFLQAGDLKSAEREFAGVLRLTPSFYPAEASLGYVELARQDPKAALPRFDRALEGRRNDVGALIGRGQTLLALDRSAEALSAFEAAVAADPSLTDLARRVEVMRFRGAEQTVERARQAARDGRLDDALQAYRTAITNSPDSPFLYRECAAVELRKGQTEEALASFRKAVSLDPSDATSHAQIGEILDSRNDFEGAELAYSTALANGAPAAVNARLEALRARVALARLPAEYRAIDQAAQITRADLAALIGIRLAPLLESVRRSDAALMTDVRAHWAAPWIFAVARAGVMEPFDNHAFQPRSVVRRIDLAQAVARLLPQAGIKTPAQVRTWESARLRFTDLQTSHLAYPAASAAVASGVMKTAGDNAFQPSRPVTGAEAIEAIGRLESLAGLGSR